MPLTPGLRPLVLDVRGLPSDVLTVDALARLQLEARRCGCCVAVHAAPELVQLLAFLGLSDVLPALSRVSGRGHGEMIVP
jgi:hypothetical protein